MRETLIAFGLQIGGFLILMLEIVIPSFGVLTLIALGFLAYSWVYIINHMGSSAVSLFAMADVILLPICFYIGVKFFKFSPLTNRNVLQRGSSLASDTQAKTLVGATGVVESQLKPVGKALVDGKLIEVSSDGDVIEKNTPVKIVRVTGMKITVEPINN